MLDRYKAWQGFLSTFTKNYIDPPEIYPDWPLPILASRTSKRDDNVPIVPEKIMELYTNETTSITPVSF